MYVILVLLAVSVLQAGAESRSELEAQIREQQFTLDSLKSRLHSIQQVDGEQKAAHKRGEMEKFLKSVFLVDSLSLGEARLMVKCCKEQYGVYVAERHLDDVYSNGDRFTKYELADSVYNVLMDARLISRSFTFVTPSISPEANSLLRSWGGGVSGAEIDYGDSNSVLVMDANSKSVSITSSGSIVTVDITNHDGSRSVATLIKGKVVGLQEFPKEEK